MWIRHARIDGYGKLVGREIDFAEGLNCVYGPNEAGKTTLLSFLVSMLYGQALPGKSRRYIHPDKDRYVPGKAMFYGGQIELAAAAGGALIVKRCFAESAEAIELLDARTGKSVLKTYFRDHTREYQFVQKEARIDKGVFESVFVIRHDSVAALDAASDSDVADRLTALADSGVEKGGSEKARRLLEDAVALIGGDRAPTRPYARVQQRHKELSAEYVRAKAARDEYAVALARRGELTGRVKTLQAGLVAERIVLLHSQAAALAAVDAERERLAAEQKTLAPAEAVPGDITRERLSVAASNAANADGRHKEALDAEADAGKQLAEAQTRMAGASPATLVDDSAVRAAEDAIAGYVERRRGLDQLLSRHGRIDEEMKAIFAKWGPELKAFEAVSKDDEAFLASAPGRKAELHERSARLADALAAARGGKEGQTVVAAAAAGATVVFLAAAVAFAALSSAAARWPIVVGAAVLAAVSACVSAVRFAGLRRSRGQASALDAEKSSVVAGIAGIEAKVAAICSPLNGRTAEAALAALADFHGDERRLEALANEGQRIEGDAEKAHAAIAETDSAAEAAAAAAFVSFAAGGAEAQNAATEGLWRSEALDSARSADEVRAAFKPLWSEQHAVAAAKRAADAARDHLEKARLAAAKTLSQRDKAAEVLAAVLHRAGVSDAAQLRALLDDRARLADVRAALKDLAAREERVLGGLAREALLAEIAGAPPMPAGAAAIAEGDLPRARKSFDDNSRRLERTTADLNAVEAALKEGLKNVREIADIEEEIKVFDKRKGGQEFQKSALGCAIRIIDEAASAFHGEVYPRIEGRLSDLIKRVTLGAHEEARLWSDTEGSSRSLSISVVDKDRGVPVAPGALSQGALEQIYLCARLALIEAFSTDERLPVMLDDPFINYDSGRLAAGVALLADVAVRHQGFLFTCQEDVRDLVQAAGGHVFAL